MPSRSTGAVVGALVALVAVLPCVADSFQVLQQGAKASGRANAFTAQADDASAVHYNPAGAAQLDGWTLYVGGTTLFQGNTTLTSPDGLKTDMQSVDDYPASIYVTGKFNNLFSIAFGANVPFALRSHWWESDPTATSNLKTRWTSRNLNFNGVFSLGEKWAIAVGVNWLKMEMQQFSSAYDFTELSAVLLPNPNEPFRAKRNFMLEGDEIGYNIAAHYKGDGISRFGVSYRSQRIVQMNGHLRWQDISEAVFVPGTQLVDSTGCTTWCPMGAAFTDSPAETSLATPATFQIGFGQVGHGNWDWEVDLLYTRWSSFQSLDILVENPNGVVLSSSTISTTTDWNQTENWSDTMTFSLGADYHFNEANTVRFGISIDPTPVRRQFVRPYNPDADRLGVTAGYGWNGLDGKLTIDTFAQIWLSEEISTTRNAGQYVVGGTYETTEYAVGLSFQYQF